ncbi:MAG: bifunctional adenosylcobinamide kinase/adenosylcobinamide-phosphate guanylyltransferase [Alphaproteobacteria bacterium]
MDAPASTAVSAASPGAPTPRTLARLTLIIGGARSGKSAHAERLVQASVAGNAIRPLYLATARAEDAEMEERIRRHKERRGARWETCEEPLEIAAALEQHARPDRPILLDCLTLWLGNLLGAGRDIAAEKARLLTALEGLAGPVVLVANEVGLGIVPDNALARRFRDAAGVLNQAVAAVAPRVILMAAGLPLAMKDAVPDDAMTDDPINGGKP